MVKTTIFVPLVKGKNIYYN